MASTHRHRPDLDSIPRERPARQPRHSRHQPLPAAVRPDCHDSVVVTISAAEKFLGVSKVTLSRWIKDGFITGGQITPALPDVSASTRTSATGFVPTSQMGDSASTRQSRPSEWPDKRCCTKSNTANSRLSTSTEDAAKGSVSRSNPTNLDCSTHPDRRNAQC
jgi:hypothetical protein